MKISKKNGVVLVVSMLLFTACGASKTTVDKIQPVANTQPVKAQEIKPFVSKEGNFSVVFGGDPKVDTSSTDIGSGVSVTMNTFTYILTPTSVKILAYTDMPSKKLSIAEVRALLKKEESGVLESYNVTKPDEEKESDYQAYPGFFYKAKTSDGVYVVAQTYFVNNRLFQIQLSNSTAYPTDAEIASFIGSFKLLN